MSRYDYLTRSTDPLGNPYDFVPDSRDRYTYHLPELLFITRNCERVRI